MSGGGAGAGNCTGCADARACRSGAGAGGAGGTASAAWGQQREKRPPGEGWTLGLAFRVERFGGWEPSNKDSDLKPKVPPSW